MKKIDHNGIDNKVHFFLQELAQFASHSIVIFSFIFKKDKRIKMIKEKYKRSWP